MRVEITVERSIPAWWQPDDRWFARAEFDGKIFTEYGYTKRGSVRALKAQLKEYRELLDDLAKGTETHVVEL